LQRITVWGVQHRTGQLRALRRREPTWHDL